MHRTPLGDPWVCYVYYGAIGILWERGVHAVHHWVTHGYICHARIHRSICHGVFQDRPTYSDGIILGRLYMHSTQLGDP